MSEDTTVAQTHTHQTIRPEPQAHTHHTSPETEATPPGKTVQTGVTFPSVLGITYISYLGQGAYGRVHLVRDEANQLKAVKTYDLRKMPDNYKTRFIPRELDLVIKLSHPNIISTHRLCKSGSFIYMEMDYARLKDLEYYILSACRGIIQESQARIWTRQIANALEYLHTVGIVHRDLKCENILISGNLNAKLADFGFCRLMRSARELSSTYCGTATYAAPEIIRNQPYNPRAADIWSLGVVLFRILTKSYPFGNHEVRNNERIRRQRAREYAFNKRFDVSTEARQVISSMLEFNPRHRITAKDIQRHRWMLKDVACRPTTLEEEAIRLAAARSDFFAAENGRVQAMATVEARTTQVEESRERSYPDNGDTLRETEEGELLSRVCQDAT